MSGRVLGIDPGTAVTGYGVIEPHNGADARLLECGVIRTSPRAALWHRLDPLFEGVTQLIKTINLIKDNLNENLQIEGILMTMADFRTKLTQEVINEVKKHFGDKVYNAVIPRNIKLSEAPGFGKPIFLYDKESEGAKKYKELAQEFLVSNTSQLISNT